MKELKTKDLKQVAMIPASPKEVYEMLMDSKKHSAFTGADAKISPKVGSRFSVWGGSIVGKTIKLVKNKEIVQEWREESWPEGHYSTVKFMLRPAGKNTKLMFSQKGIPASRYKDISDGWKEYYWGPMKEYADAIRSRRAKG
jgi:activator of HSP90 ATPase